MDNPMELVYSAWWALKMTFGIMPGLCVVAYAFECGYEKKAFKISGIISLLEESKRAKREAIKETAKLFFPLRPVFGVLLLGGILFIIIGDSLMLIVTNITAIPLGLYSYHQGKILHKAMGIICLDRQDPEYEARMRRIVKAVFPHAIRIFLIWISLIAAILTIAYYLNLWKPH